MKKRLQGIGIVNGKLVKDLKIGDVVLWNFGETSKIIDIEDTSKCFVTIKYMYDNKIQGRRLKKDRIVGISKKGKNHGND